MENNTSFDEKYNYNRVYERPYIEYANYKWEELNTATRQWAALTGFETDQLHYEKLSESTG